jgi:hypothetical protein
MSQFLILSDILMVYNNLIILPIRDRINEIIIKYDYHAFIIINKINEIIFKLYFLYIIFVFIFNTIFILSFISNFIFDFIFINFFIILNENHSLLYVLQNLNLITCVHCDTTCEYDKQISADILDQSDNIFSHLEIASGISSHATMGQLPYEALHLLNIAKIPITTNAGLDTIIEEINPDEGKKVLEIFKDIQLNKYDASVYTKKFPLKVVDIDITSNKLFGFSSNYQNLDIYNYIFGSTSANADDAGLNIKMIILPEKNFFLKNLNNYYYKYIPTDCELSEVNFKNPIIFGSIVLPELRDPLDFITNLVSLEELKQQEPLLNNKSSQIEIFVGKEIDIIKVQRYIQGTVRAAILDLIEIYEYLY